MKKGKLLKRSLACILSLMIIIASMPVAALTASAADTAITKSVNVSYAGVLQGGGNSRWLSGSVLNLVNDQCYDNFDIGFVSFDVSGISDTPDFNVKYKLKVNCASGREALGMTMYYPRQNLDCFKSNANTSCTSTSNSDLYNSIFVDERVDHIGRAKKYFDLQQIGESIDTKADGTDYNHEIDITSAVRYAVQNNNQYATLVIMAAKQGGYKNTEGTVKAWSDTSVYLNETSATMTYSVVDSKDVTDIKLGVITNGTGTRYTTSDSQPVITVANDQENSNFTIGYASFDISALSTDCASAKAEFTFNEYLLSNECEAMGLSYYYPTVNLGDFTHANGTVNKSSVTSIYKSGNNTDYISSAINYYGLVKMGSFETAAKENKNRTIDISSAINAALNRGETKARVVFMLSAPGGSAAAKSDKALDSSSTNSNYWSDTMIKLISNTSVSVNYTERADTKVSNVKANVDSFSGYKGTFDTKFNSSSSQSNNVLYSANPTTYTSGEIVASSPNGSLGAWYASAKVKLCIPATTFLYDGTNEMYNTIAFAGMRKDDGCLYSIINMVYPTTGSGATADSSEFKLKETWKGQTTNFELPTSTDWQVGYSSTTRYGTNTFDGSYHLLQNKLYYTATPSTTLTSYTKMYWRIQADIGTISTIGADMTRDQNRRAQTTSDATVDIRIVNIKKLKDIADNLKSGNVEQYNKIVQDKTRYYGDESAVNTYLKSINDIVTFNPNSYFSATNNGYEACASRINVLYDNYVTALSNLKQKYEVKFVNKDGAIVDTRYAYSGDVITTNAQNSQVTYSTISGNADEHKKITYSWPTVTVTADVTVNEIKNETNEAHTKTYTQVDGDGTEHKMTCSVCNYTETSKHDFDGKTECPCGQTIDDSVYKSEVSYASEIKYITGASSGYKDSSINEYFAKVQEIANGRNSVHSQAELDDLTVQILYARSLLKKEKNTVNLIVYNKDGNADLSAGQTYSELERNSTVTVTPKTKHNVVKWVIESNGAKRELVGEMSSLDLVVTGDATVYAYCDDSASDTENTYTKVIFKGSNGKVVAIKYVKDGETINTSSVEKPSLALYTVGDWNVSEVTGSADKKEVIVTASCEPDTKYQCGIHFAGRTDIITKPYDTRIDINDYIQNENVTYALAKDAAGNDVIAYIDGTVFYVPARADVYVVKKSAGTKTTMINTVGVYTTTRGTGDSAKKTVGFNCKFSLAEGCKAVEWGVVFIPVYNKDGGGTTLGTSVVAPIKSLSAQNEYTARINIPATSTSYNGIRAKAYLKYKDESGTECVIYGNENTQAFDANTKFWEVK